MDDDPFSDDTVFVPFAFQLGADGNRQAKKRGHWQALSPCRASRRKLAGYTATKLKGADRLYSTKLKGPGYRDCQQAWSGDDRISWLYDNHRQVP